MWWWTAQYFGFCCLLSGWICLLLRAGFALCGGAADPAHSLLQALGERQRSRSVCNLRQFLLLLPLALFSTLCVHISQPWGKMPLRELQDGALVTPWRDKQQTATGICGIKMTLTLHAFFTLLIQLHRHRSYKGISGIGYTVLKWKLNENSVLRITELQCDLRIMPVIMVFSKNISLNAWWELVYFVFARKQVCPFFTVP